MTSYGNPESGSVNWTQNLRAVLAILFRLPDDDSRKPFCFASEIFLAIQTIRDKSLTLTLF